MGLRLIRFQLFGVASFSALDCTCCHGQKHEHMDVDSFAGSCYPVFFGSSGLETERPRYGNVGRVGTMHVPVILE